MFGDCEFALGILVSPLTVIFNCFSSSSSSVAVVVVVVRPVLCNRNFVISVFWEMPKVKHQIYFKH